MHLDLQRRRALVGAVLLTISLTVACGGEGEAAEEAGATTFAEDTAAETTTTEPPATEPAPSTRAMTNEPAATEPAATEPAADLPPGEPATSLDGYGSSGEWDDWAVQCQDGLMVACDALWIDAEGGYAAYGQTCGGRVPPHGPDDYCQQLVFSPGR